MRSIIFTLLLHFCLFYVNDTFAQTTKSQPIKPRWIHKMPKPSNDTFTYEIDFAVASTLDKAREKSVAGIIANSGLENGVVIISDYESKIVDSQVLHDGKIQDLQNENIEINSRIKGSETSLHLKDIAEYWVRDASGEYHLTKLYAISRQAGTPIFDDVTTTTKYGVRGLWRSMIIPGWGQFHKGANLKGGLLLGGSAVLATGVIFTEGQRADYNKRMFQTHDTSSIRSYQTKRDNFTTARNICIGATAALYLYNIIDAIAAPGAQRIIKSSNKGGKFAFAPSTTVEGTPVLTANLKF